MSDQRPDHDTDLGPEPRAADDEPEPWTAGLAADAPGSATSPDRELTADEPSPWTTGDEDDESLEPSPWSMGDEDDESLEPSPWSVGDDADADEPSPWTMGDDEEDDEDGEQPEDRSPWAVGADASEVGGEPAPWGATYDTSDDDASDDDPSPWVSSDETSAEGERTEIHEDDDFDLAALEAAMVELGADEGTTTAGTDRGGAGDVEPSPPGGGAAPGNPPAAWERGSERGPWEDDTVAPAPRTTLTDELTVPAGDADDDDRGGPVPAPTPGGDPSTADVDLTNFTAKGGSGAAGRRGKGRRGLFGR